MWYSQLSENMIVTNSEPMWDSIEELADALQKAYSVTGKDAIIDGYLEQVKQYPLYSVWFDKIVSRIEQEEYPISVLEYGPGPGILAERLVRHPNVKQYLAVEPEEIFREMTKERTNGLALVVSGNAEEYIAPEPIDLIVCIATYHHFSNKPAALKSIYDNLRQGGKLIIADVFLPVYRYDEYYRPVDKIEFIESVLEYSVAQICAMPNPRMEYIADQMKTAFLDMLRVEELKVCAPIIEDQLKETGFRDVQCELLADDALTDCAALGYYYLTALKEAEDVT